MNAKVGNAYVFYQSVDPGKVELFQAIANGLMVFPTLRLCQLINNVRTTDPVFRTNTDEFYIRDKDLADAINRFVERHGSP